VVSCWWLASLEKAVTMVLFSVRLSEREETDGTSAERRRWSQEVTLTGKRESIITFSNFWEFGSRM